MRDVGELNLAFGVLLVLAAIMLDRRLVQVSLFAYLFYAVPHFIFHLTRTRAFSPEDNLAQLASLGVQVFLPLAILLSVGLRRKNGRAVVGR